MEFRVIIDEQCNHLLELQAEIAFKNAKLEGGFTSMDGLLNKVSTAELPQADCSLLEKLAECETITLQLKTELENERNQSQAYRESIIQGLIALERWTEKASKYENVSIEEANMVAMQQVGLKFEKLMEESSRMREENKIKEENISILQESFNKQETLVFQYGEYLESKDVVISTLVEGENRMKLEIEKLEQLNEDREIQLNYVSEQLVSTLKLLESKGVEYNDLFQKASENQCIASELREQLKAKSVEYLLLMGQLSASERNGVAAVDANLKEITELKEKLVLMEKSVLFSNQSMEMLQKTIDKNEEEKRTLINRMNQNTVQLNDFMLKMESVEAKYTVVSDQLTSKTQLYSECKEMKKTLEKSVGKLTEELAEYARRIVEKDIRIDELETTNQSLVSENICMRDSIADLVREQDCAHDLLVASDSSLVKTFSADATLNVMCDKLTSLGYQLKTKSENLLNLENNIMNVNKLFEEYEIQLNDLDASILEIRLNSEERKEEMSRLQVEYDTETSAAETFQSTIEIKRISYEELLQESYQLDLRIDDQKKNISGKLCHLNSSVVRNDTLRVEHEDEINRLNRKCDEYELLLEQSKEHLEGNDCKLNAMAIELDNCLNQLSDCKERLIEKCQELTCLEKKFADQCAVANEIENSAELLRAVDSELIHADVEYPEVSYTDYLAQDVMELQDRLRLMEEGEIELKEYCYNMKVLVEKSTNEQEVIEASLNNYEKLYEKQQQQLSRLCMSLEDRLQCMVPHVKSSAHTVVSEDVISFKAIILKFLAILFLGTAFYCILSFNQDTYFAMQYGIHRKGWSELSYYRILEAYCRCPLAESNSKLVELVNEAWTKLLFDLGALMTLTSEHTNVFRTFNFLLSHYICKISVFALDVLCEIIHSLERLRMTS